MEIQNDLLDSLDRDMLITVLMCLDDPADIVRAGSVSRAWRDFVISNGVCKQICLRLFPQLSSVARLIDISNRMEKPVDVECSSSIEWDYEKMEHRTYASLAQRLTSSEMESCIAAAISASSTDNDPEESIQNTLEPRDRVGRRASYWSSSGQKNAAVPEKLTYKLVSDICVITEISVQPFQAFFQANSPIYSAKAVRFHMGHQILSDNGEGDHQGQGGKQSDDGKFIWTYTSEEFPMAQEKCLQKFKLPQAVLCIGGILQIELLGRVQKQEMDGLLYICITHVQVMGRSLSPVFGVEILEPSGKFLLKYDSQARYCPPTSAGGSVETPEGSMLAPGLLQRRHVRGWEILNLFRGNIGVEVYDSDDENNDSDEEFDA
ncbi:hypothetical protein Nepgr_023541 [Nepenthes gracilis]|uniref:F-box domain-containing protein n=1 Tax=Nepenthes gracilis TaxID=150966 RepID=A0AAD3T309_NEPGR|nr:hypothetical protein Nepgr_023541 [Nepenthes gracilis]